MNSPKEKLIPWWSTSFNQGEASAITKAIKNRNISQGKITEEFEIAIATYLKVPHVIAVTSGSDALLLSLLACGIKNGDEVIVPNRTWIATVHAIKLLGATPIFVDTKEDIQVMNEDEIESKITKKTKAIIPVYMNGQEVDIKKIKELIKDKDIKIIEDAAQALGSKDKKGFYLGTRGDIGCFSLSVAKIISTGQGGFVVTRNDEMAFKLRRMRTHGVENIINVDSWDMLGFNFRFNDILASIGIVQMRHLDKRILRIKDIQKLYKQGLDGIRNIKLIENTKNTIGPYIEILTTNRGELVDRLKKNNIESRPFYPDVQTANYFKPTNTAKNSSKISEQGLYLPSGPSLKNTYIKRVINVVREFYG